MTNPFQTAPRCVQWAAVLLGALPVFQTIVAFGTMPFGRFLWLLEVSLPNIGIMLGLAAGLLFGLNLVRILFAGLVVYWAAIEVFAWYHLGFFSMSLVSDATARLLPSVSLVLCFLPAANRYFSDNAEPNQAQKTETPAPAKPRVSAATTKLVAGIVVVGIILLKVFGPALRDASYQGPELGAARERIRDGAKDIQIGNNLRQLIAATAQFSMENPGKTARYADLVGPNKLIVRLPPVAGEKYPDAYSLDTAPVAIMPDGTILSYDPQTFQTRRAAPAK